MAASIHGGIRLATIRLSSTSRYGPEHSGQDLWEEVAPVKSFEPNAWGLYDVVGNVREWCLDWYEDKYDSGAADDPKGPATGRTGLTKRVLS